MCPESLPYFEDFYKYTENLLNTKLLFEKEIIKFFSIPSDIPFWLKKSKENKFLSNKIYQQKINGVIKQELGYSEILNSGMVDTKLLLDKTESYFLEKDIYLNEKFEYDKLKIFKDHVEYKNIISQKIIFCEGHHVKNNPFFDFVNIIPVKGEILTVEIKDLNLPDKIIQKGVYIIPIQKDIYKIGSSYEWNNISETPTEKTKNQIIDSLSKIIRLDVNILTHEAGIRPSVVDRKPIVGYHPVYKNLGILNGLGSKGVLVSPYLSYLLLNNSFSFDISINRFLKKDEKAT
jgi:glycine oxidase